jgi:hypothetical protein
MLENMQAPFCMFSSTVNADKRNYIIMGFNPAFKEKVNRAVEIGKTLGEISPQTAEYLAPIFERVEVQNKDEGIKDYYCHNTGVYFKDVLLLPVRLLGKQAVGMAFLSETEDKEAPIPVNNVVVALLGAIRADIAAVKSVGDALEVLDAYIEFRKLADSIVQTPLLAGNRLP